MPRNSTVYAVVGGSLLSEGRYFDCQIIHCTTQTSFNYHFKGTLENCLEWAQLKCYSYHFVTTRNRQQERSRFQQLLGI